MLPYDPSGFRAACTELDAWRERLDASGPLPRAWEGRLRRDLEAEAVAASTSMEGVPVTVDDVRRILAGGHPVEVREEDRLLVAGYRDAMGFVLRRADDTAFQWDRELLVGLHDRILGGRYTLGAGRLRTGPRYLVDSVTGERTFVPPEPDAVPALVDEMFAEMRGLRTPTGTTLSPTGAFVERGSADHPAVAAAWVHVATAAIHPFADGNGRTARVLASLAMYRGGFRHRAFTSLEEWWGRHRGDYYAAFACLGPAFERHADVTSFIQAHVAAQLSQVRALDLRQRVERQIWTVLENVVADVGLEPRVANAAWDGFFHRKVTAGYYRSLTDVSPATATHDLVAATAAGLLRAEGQRRGRRYRAGPRLHLLVASELNVNLAGIPEDATRSAIVGAITMRESTQGL